MELVQKGVLFLFKGEIKRDILSFFRGKGVYCEAIKEELLDSYIKNNNPQFIIKDIEVKDITLSNYTIPTFNLKKYNETEFDRIMKFLEENHVDKFWNLDFFMEYVTKMIKDTFKNSEKPILPLSTGVDSTVLAILLGNILNRNIKCVYINTGLNRLTDYDDLEYIEKKYPLLVVEKVNVSNIVIKELKGIYKQEDKKKIIKEIFRKTLNEKLKEYTEKNNYKLVHGSIVTDTFGLFKTDKNTIAPLNCLIKEEVRDLGRKFGLDDKLVEKLKFPVVGYARKIVGEITKEKLDKVKLIDKKFCEEMYTKNKYVLRAQYIDVSIIACDDINIFVYRVDRRIIDNGTISLEDCIEIIRKIELENSFINKSLFDVSIDTDTFLVKR